MERLPRGRHGLSQQFVAENQRGRLIGAVTAILLERGYERMTVSLIGERAHVSKSDFYRHFASKDACFFAAYDAGVEVVHGCAREGCAGADWGTRVAAGLLSLLECLAADPARANLVLVEGLRAGRGMYDRYQEALRSFVPLVGDGAPRGEGGESPPEATAEAVVGGIASLLGRRVQNGEAERLAEFFPEVAEFALTPYLGAAEARRIISAG